MSDITNSDITERKEILNSAYDRYNDRNNNYFDRLEAALTIDGIEKSAAEGARNSRAKNQTSKVDYLLSRLPATTEDAPPIIRDDEKINFLALLVKQCGFKKKKPKKKEKQAPDNGGSTDSEDSNIEDTFYQKLCRLLEPLSKGTGFDVIGTHSLYLQDNSGERAFYSDAVVSEQACHSKFVNSFAMNVRVPHAASGNGALNKFYLFMTKPFIVDGKATSVYESLLEKGFCYRAFIDWGYDEEELAQFVGKLIQIKESKIPKKISRACKELAWPVGDGSYHVITPVASFSMLAEMQLRLKERRVKGNKLSTRSVIVGGTSPQNVSSLTKDGHPQPRLISDPPGGKMSDDQKLQYKISNGFPLIKERIRTKHVDRLTVVFNKDDRTNKESTVRRIKSVSDAIYEDTLSELRVAHKEYLLAPDEQSIKKLPEPERILIQNTRSASTMPVATKRVIFDYVTQAFYSAIKNSGFTIDDDMHNITQEAIVIAIDKARSI